MSASKLIYSSPGPKSQSAVSYASNRDRALSPSRAKISQLTEKLSNLQHSINEDQAFKKETFEQKVKILEDKVTKQLQSDDSKFKLLKEQLSKVKEGAQNEKIIREVSLFSISNILEFKFNIMKFNVFQEHNITNFFKLIVFNKKSADEKLRTKYLKGLEANLNKELQGEKVNRKDYEQKIIKNINDRVYSLRLDLARQKKLKIEFFNYKKKQKKNENRKSHKINKLLRDWEIQFQNYRKSQQQKSNREKLLKHRCLEMLEEMNSYLNGELNAEKK